MPMVSTVHSECFQYLKLVIDIYLKLSENGKYTIGKKLGSTLFRSIVWPSKQELSDKSTFLLSVLLIHIDPKPFSQYISRFGFFMFLTALSAILQVYRDTTKSVYFYHRIQTNPY